MSTRAALLLGLVLAAGPAWAWPVDWVHDVAPGQEKFVKLPRLSWVEVEDPRVLDAEWFEGNGELMLTGKQAGRTLVLLGSEGKAAAWRVRVGSRPVEDAVKRNAAKDACPDLREPPDGDWKLLVTVASEKCRRALLDWFEGDSVEARFAEITFEPQVLQTQLKAIQAALDQATGKAVTARYVGAGLVLEGKLTQAQHRAGLWALFRVALGRFALDDQCEVEVPEVVKEPEPEVVPDAGVVVVKPDAGVARPRRR